MLDHVLLGWKVTIRLHAFDSLTAGALPFTRSAQLQDGHSLVKFAHCSKHLANQTARRVVPIVSEVNAISRQDASTDL